MLNENLIGLSTRRLNMMLKLSTSSVQHTVPGRVVDIVFKYNKEELLAYGFTIGSTHEPTMFSSFTYDAFDSLDHEIINEITNRAINIYTFQVLH